MKKILAVFGAAAGLIPFALARASPAAVNAYYGGDCIAADYGLWQCGVGSAETSGLVLGLFALAALFLWFKTKK